MRAFHLRNAERGLCADRQRDGDKAGQSRLSYSQLAGHGDETVTGETGLGPGDQTYMTQDDDDAALMQRKPTNASTPAKPPLKSALKKPSSDMAKASRPAAPGVAKGRITVAEKKKREVSRGCGCRWRSGPHSDQRSLPRQAKAGEIIETLPLEYRGSDPVSGALPYKATVLISSRLPETWAAGQERHSCAHCRRRQGCAE